MFGIIVSPITNDTTAANVESYGDIIDMDTAFDTGFARTFCDGQTSPVPPRWADDTAGIIYTYDKRTAELFQGILRRDVSERIASGVIQQSPTWLKSAELTSILAGSRINGVIDSVRNAGNISLEVTDGQIQTAMQNYVVTTGKANPSIAELLTWIEENAGWVE
ncbi:MAG: hypothetical protein KAS32_21965 [Candidatus Peribacteraceae bacterium]|nr:hypothetical protein [Candidatus Peribacteraceae bacterium]